MISNILNFCFHTQANFVIFMKILRIDKKHYSSINWIDFSLYLQKIIARSSAENWAVGYKSTWNQRIIITSSTCQLLRKCQSCIGMCWIRFFIVCKTIVRINKICLLNVCIRSFFFHSVESWDIAEESRSQNAVPSFILLYAEFSLSSWRRCNGVFLFIFMRRGDRCHTPDIWTFFRVHTQTGLHRLYG